MKIFKIKEYSIVKKIKGEETFKLEYFSLFNDF